MVLYNTEPAQCRRRLRTSNLKWLYAITALARRDAYRRWFRFAERQQLLIVFSICATNGPIGEHVCSKSVWRRIWQTRSVRRRVFTNACISDQLIEITRRRCSFRGVEMISEPDAGDGSSRPIADAGNVSTLIRCQSDTHVSLPTLASKRRHACAP